MEYQKLGTFLCSLLTGATMKKKLSKIYVKCQQVQVNEDFLYVLILKLPDDSLKKIATCFRFRAY